MARTSALVFFILCLTFHSNGRVYPGTENRPVLSDEEASKYTIKNYLLGWEPEEIVIPDKPDYIVNQSQSIQEVVNWAIQNGTSDTRTYIRIEPGFYEETVYINGNVPITIYGGGNDPEDVTISTTLSEILTATDYRNFINKYGWRYKKGDQAWDLYNYCATKNGTVGLECSAIMWVNSSNFQLHGLTVYNVATYAAGVAIRTSVDKISIVNSNLRGYSNTVGLGIGDDENEEIERVYVHNCFIEGEIDFVFGGATAIFNSTTFMITVLAEVNAPVIFSPDTPPERSYGFLVINSNITGFEEYIGSGKVLLARSWDKGVSSADKYIPGESPNGQLVIRDTNIDNVTNIEAPYEAAVPSQRNFTTDISKDRNLNDGSYNRFWEYNNTGLGA